MRRYIFCGSRDWSPDLIVKEVLRRLATQYAVDQVTIVVGDCPSGVDPLVERLAKQWGFKVEKHEAYWRELGLSAGPRRNRRMVQAGANMAFGFSKDIKKSRGTRNCLGLAIAAGIHSIIWHGERYEDMRQYGLSEIDR